MKSKAATSKWLLLSMPILANVGFGLYPVAVKIFASGAKEKANSYVFTMYRAAGAFPLLFLASYYMEGKVQIPDAHMTMVFASFGFIVVFLGQFLYITGAYYVGPDITSAMQPLIAVWTAIIVIICRMEKISSFTMVHTYAKLAGVLMAVVGAASLISSSPPEGTAWQRSIGYLALLLDTFCGAVYYVLQKKLLFSREDCIWKAYPTAGLAYTYFFGFLFMLMSIMYYVFTGQLELFLLPRQSLPALVYAIFIISVTCYLLVTYANKFLPSSVVTAMWPVQVLVTVVSAYVFIGDEFTLQQCFSAVFIILGIFLVLYSNHVDEQLARGKDAGTRLEDCCSDTRDSC